MRISDWSSDVCSSDLIDHADVARPHPAVDEDLCILFRPPPITLHHLRTAKGDFPRLARRGAFRRVLAVHQHDAGAGQRLTDGAGLVEAPISSEERRVGKEGVSTGSTRWWRHH